MAVELQRWRFTVNDYHRMGETGILTEEDRVELLDGEIVRMSPIGGPHAAAVDRANQFFNRKVGDEAIVRVQNPVRLDEFNEPEPDITLLRPRPDFYATTHPGPQDILLILEVADSTIAKDRRVKLPLYARAGVSETWILNVPGEALEVHREPTATGYKQVRRLRRGERIAPLAFPDLLVSVDDLLGL